MNERIRELARQADPDYTGEYDDDMGHALVGDQAIQKFAELIVKKCADLFEVEWGDEKLTGNLAGYVVRKHFGVKE